MLTQRITAHQTMKKNFMLASKWNGGEKRETAAAIERARAHLLIIHKNQSTVNFHSILVGTDRMFIAAFRFVLQSYCGID